MIDRSGRQPQRDSWQFLDHPRWILQAWFGPFRTFLRFNVENPFYFCRISRFHLYGSVRCTGRRNKLKFYSLHVDLPGTLHVRYTRAELIPGRSVAYAANICYWTSKCFSTVQ